MLPEMHLELSSGSVIWVTRQMYQIKGTHPTMTYKTAYLVDEVKHFGQNVTAFSDVYRSFIESSCLSKRKRVIVSENY